MLMGRNACTNLGVDHALQEPLQLAANVYSELARLRQELPLPLGITLADGDCAAAGALSLLGRQVCMARAFMHCEWLLWRGRVRDCTAADADWAGMVSQLGAHSACLPWCCACAAHPQG